jgi:hypothetical protein
MRSPRRARCAASARVAKAGLDADAHHCSRRTPRSGDRSDHEVMAATELQTRCSGTSSVAGMMVRARDLSSKSRVAIAVHREPFESTDLGMEPATALPMYQRHGPLGRARISMVIRSMSFARGVHSGSPSCLRHTQASGGWHGTVSTILER